MDNFDLKKYLAEGKLYEEDFKNPILDKYLELKKSIDYKTVFPTDLQSFLDSLDNTEREGLKRDLAEGRIHLKEGKFGNVIQSLTQDISKAQDEGDTKMVSILKSYLPKLKTSEGDDEVESTLNALDTELAREFGESFDIVGSYLAEGKLYESSIPSGWKKIDTSNDYEKESQQGRLMGFEAPMNGIEGDEVDSIYIEQDENEYEVHIMTAFNKPEYEGPFSSKEEALKVAIQKMEDLKKDWDE